MLSQYFQFKDWADAQTIEAATHLAQDCASLDFVRQQLNHMVIVEDLFKARIQGQTDPHQHTNSKTLPTLETLKNRKLALNRWFNDFIAEAQQQELNREVRFTFKDGQSGMMLVHEILFHIVTHASYHRGNIARALDLAGIPHPVDGYGIYIHQAEPERRKTS